MKIQESTSGTLMVSIPRDLSKLMGLAKGTDVAITTGKDGCLEIRKI